MQKSEKSAKARSVVEQIAKNHPMVKERAEIEQMRAEHEKMRLALIRLRDHDWANETVKYVCREVLAGIV